MNLRYLSISSCLLGILSFTGTANASGPYEVGLRADVRLGSGKPANDILGAAAILRYRLANPNWWIGASIDHSPEFDVEVPLKFFGLESEGEVADSIAVSTMVSVFVEYQHGADRLGWIPFGTLGLGINNIDVDDNSGTLSTGGPFNLKIDADTETVIEGSAGIRYQFSRTWSVSASALLQHRIADWTVEETESGQTTTIDDYTVSGAYFGVNYRF